MCLILVGVDPRPGSRVVLLANRDEFHDRPTAPAAPWGEDPNIVGGKDLRAGGSWLAARSDGRFAAVTNIRSGIPKPAPRSRGDLVKDFVRGDRAAPEWLEALRPELDQYAPFNLILGDGVSVMAFDGVTRQQRTLAAGFHAVSNGSLDAAWPKMQRIRALAADAIIDGTPPDELLVLLGDQQIASDEHLPKTGYALEQERLLSSIFILGDRYGTRASTLLELRDSGRINLIERRFGPHGAPLGGDHWQHLPNTGDWRRILPQ